MGVSELYCNGLYFNLSRSNIPTSGPRKSPAGTFSPPSPHPAKTGPPTRPEAPRVENYTRPCPVGAGLRRVPGPVGQIAISIGNESRRP